MLWKLDRIMGRDEARESSKRFTRVGIGFYVFEDPQVTGVTERKRGVDRGTHRRATRGNRRR